MPQLRDNSLIECPQVEWLPPRALRANPANARTHSAKQINQIAASIRKFGFLSPVLIDDGNMILAGHGRWQAAQIEGFARIPVLRIGHLTAAQKRAFVIADNRIAEQAGWDRELLAIELGELSELLPEEGLDVTVTGFEMPEIDALLKDLSTSLPEPDETRRDLPINPVTNRGDLWHLGKHRLLCGDAQVPGNFVRLLNGAVAAAVFCDPPYNVRVRTIGGRGRIRHQEFAFASGEMSTTQYRTFLRQTLGNGIHVSLAGAVHFICTDWRHVADLIGVGGELYETMLNLVVWNKTNAGQGAFYRSQHELIGVFRVAGHPHQNNVELGRFGRNRSNVWTYAGVNSFGRDRLESLAAHPTVKPVAMVADALLDCTARGDIVLDQFAGSGTIFQAAEKVGRIGFGIEYEPAYVDVAINRWQQWTRLEATLDGDGRSYEEISKIRLHKSVDPQNQSTTLETDRKKHRRATRPSKSALADAKRKDRHG